ncbi:MAG: 50S ribosomal protein L3 [Oligoflexales bacterium]
MMTHGLLAKKIGMTRVVDDNGNMVPVTLLQIEKQGVTKIITPERDGGHGIQIGYNVKAEKKLTKADVTRLRKVQVDSNFSKFKEFRFQEAPKTEFTLNQILTAELLTGITSVDVTGFTKGRGFTGALRRWNSACGRMTHGSRFHRRPGSLGMRSTPGRVFKNKHQPGQWGNEQTTVRNLSVVDIDTSNNVVALKGSVPGFRDGFVIISPSTKSVSKEG